MKARLILFCCVFLSPIGLSSSALSYPPPRPADPGGLQTVEKACVKYAADAIAQYQEMVRLKCGLSGPAWNGDRNAHLQWCMATGGNHAADESRKRQAALKTCRESACRAYAQSAIRQQRENAQKSCGFSGPAWDPGFDHHYQWCVRGGNQLRAAAEERRRDAQLAKCAVEAPLDGDFKIVAVVPHLAGGKDERYLQSADIIVEATSARPWTIGDYGHHKYGSLWAEVTVNAKIAPNGAIQNRRQSYLFSIRGTAAGTQSFVTPHSGQQVGAGTRTLKLTVAPQPRIPLTGVEEMFSVPGQPLGPGETGCWYSNPEVSVKVFVVTTANTATMRSGKSQPIMNATMIRVFRSPKGGFNEGVVHHRCR